MSGYPKFAESVIEDLVASVRTLERNHPNPVSPSYVLGYIQVQIEDAINAAFRMGRTDQGPERGFFPPVPATIPPVPVELPEPGWQG